jgi:hypothetical protein
MIAGLVERWLMHMRSLWFISTYLEMIANQRKSKEKESFISFLFNSNFGKYHGRLADLSFFGKEPTNRSF